MGPVGMVACAGGLSLHGNVLALNNPGFFATDYGVQPALAATRSYFVRQIWTF